MRTATPAMMSIYDLTLVITCYERVEGIDGFPSPVIFFVMRRCRRKVDKGSIDESNAVLKERTQADTLLNHLLFGWSRPSYILLLKLKDCVDAPICIVIDTTS